MTPEFLAMVQARRKEKLNHMRDMIYNIVTTRPKTRRGGNRTMYKVSDILKAIKARKK